MFLDSKQIMCFI